jgi:hypothetical protein
VYVHIETVCKQGNALLPWGCSLRLLPPSNAEGCSLFRANWIVRGWLRRLGRCPWNLSLARTAAFTSSNSTKPTALCDVCVSNVIQENTEVQE